MKPAHLAPPLRDDLDRRFKKWKAAVRDKPPAQGWVREIREALGMSAAQLARQLKISQQGVAALERAESKGRVRLDTLRKTAKALNCEFVYALVPKKPLARTLRQRAFGMLLPEVMLTIQKQNIKLPIGMIRQMINKLIDRRRMLDKPRLLWNEIRLPEEYMQPFSAYAGAGRKPKPKAAMSEEQIAALPPGIQELARQGKVEL